MRTSSRCHTRLCTSSRCHTRLCTSSRCRTRLCTSSTCHTRLQLWSQDLLCAQVWYNSLTILVPIAHCTQSCDYSIGTTKSQIRPCIFNTVITRLNAVCNVQSGLEMVKLLLHIQSVYRYVIWDIIPPLSVKQWDTTSCMGGVSLV